MLNIKCFCNNLGFILTLFWRSFLVFDLFPLCICFPIRLTIPAKQSINSAMIQRNRCRCSISKKFKEWTSWSRSRSFAE